MGVAVIVLIVVIMKLWAGRESDRQTHKVELAAKDALIKELQDQRLELALAGRDIVRTLQATLDAIAMRAGKGS